MRRLLLLLLFPLPLLAQTGAVTGVALDSVGNTVAGATITVCAQGSPGIPCSPVTASTTSNGQGAFSVTVPIGTYTVTVFRSGVVSTSSTVVVAPSNITVANNTTYSGTTTFTGATTITGTASYLCKNFENVRCVDSANSAGWAGTDIAGWINSAYADLPSPGGKILIAPKSDNTCYITAAVITAGQTAGKPLMLEGGGGASPTCINYTATTGTFITLDPGLGATANVSRGGGVTTGSEGFYGLGVRNLTLYGPGKGTGTAVAIQIGKNSGNGSEGATIESVSIEQFHQALVFGTSVPILGMELRRSRIGNNDQAVFASSSVQGLENIRFDFDIFSDNTAELANCVQLDAAMQIAMNNNSFDSCQLEINTAQVTLYSPHIENPSGSPTGCSTNDPIVLTRGRLTIYDAQIVQDCPSPNTMFTEFISVGASTGNNEYLKVYGGGVGNSNFTSLTQVVKHQGGASVTFDMPAVNVTAGGAISFTNGLVFCSSCTGPEVVLPVASGNSGATTYTQAKYTTGLAVGNNTAFASVPTAGGTPIPLLKLDASDQVHFLSQNSGFYIFDTSGSVSPATTASTSLGLGVAPWNSLFIGTAGTNNFKFQPAATAAARVISLPDPLGNVLLGESLNTGTGVYQTGTGAGCTTAASIGGVCASAATVTFAASFADTNYKVSCSPNGAPTNLPSSPYVVTKSVGNVTVNYFAITAAAASWPNIECVAVHN